jgi:curved DNA-binding protein CbpA
MRRLVEEIVFSTFEWSDGEYKFQSSTGVLDPDVALTLSTAAVIVEGIRRLPESDLFRERLGDGKQVPVLSSDPMSRYQYLPLSPQEAYILSRIDGRLDLDSLLKIGGTSRAATGKILYGLLSCGIVEWRQEGAAPQATSGLEALNVEVAAHAGERTPGHAELVRNTYRRIDWLSHYELLGVRPEAGVEEINQAYFERSRLFHPDLRHREDLAHCERELTTVFERLKVAHETLADADKRNGYDASLAAPSVPMAPAPDVAAANPQARRQLASQNYRRAKALIDQKDYHPAVEMLREAIRFVPDNGEYRFTLAQVELKNTMWVARGLENLKEAARLEPRRAQYVREAAVALHERGRSAEAEPFARRALDLDPTPDNQRLLDDVLHATAGGGGGSGAGAVPSAAAAPSATAESLPADPALTPRPDDRPTLFSRLFKPRN